MRSWLGMIVSCHSKPGKRRTYTQQQISDAAQSVGYPIDVHCWAYCIFMDQGAFEAFHLSIGEACDYTEMKSTMLDGLSEGGFQMPDLGLSWLEWPDIDLSFIGDWSSS